MRDEMTLLAESLVAMGQILLIYLTLPAVLLLIIIYYAKHR